MKKILFTLPILLLLSACKGPSVSGEKSSIATDTIALERLSQTSSALSIKDFKPDYNLITQIDTAGRTVNGEYHPYDMKNDLDSISFEEYKQYEESFLDNITTAFKDSIQVGTLKLGGRYTREQIEAVFGKPTLWFSWGAYNLSGNIRYSDVYLFGYINPGLDPVYFGDDFQAFDVRVFLMDNFLTSFIASVRGIGILDGSIQVGDPISKLSDLSAKYIVSPETSYFSGEKGFYIKIQGFDGFNCFLAVQNDKIAWASLSAFDV